MRSFIPCLGALLLLAPLPASSADLQVVAEPGVKVWLNGRYKGRATSQEGGRFFEKLPPGHFVVKAQKEGHRAQKKSGRLSRGLTTTVEFAFKAATKRRATRPQKKKRSKRQRRAGLRVRSAPPSPPADIHLDGQWIGRTPLTLQNVTAGAHRLELRRRDQMLAADLDLQPGARARVKGHFLQGEVLDETRGEKVVVASRRATPGASVGADALDSTSPRPLELQAGGGWRVRYEGQPDSDADARLRLEFNPKQKTITVFLGDRHPGVPIDDLK